MIKKLSLILTMLVCATCAGYGQGEFYFRHYQVENGLSHNTVMCSLQDNKGFLWMGTKDGLNRFDGNAFKVFRPDAADSNSIGNGYIRCLFLDKTGRMFAGTQSGLYEFNALTESFSHIASSQHKSIDEICVDKNNDLWYIAEGVLFCQQKSKLLQYAAPAFFSATAICTRPDGTLWVAASNGQLYKYNYTEGGSFTAVALLNGQASGTNWIETIYATQNEILLGTSSQGLYSFDINSGIIQSVIKQNQDKTGIYVRDILQVAEDEYWLATESGIFVYHPKKKTVINLKKNYHNPYSLSDNAVYTLCKDKESGIWAGTYFGGINYYAKNQLQFKKYFPDYSKTSISGNAVREIVQDDYGNLWIGTEDAGLNKIDSNGRITHFMPSGNKTDLSYYNIHGLLAVGNKLWVGTFEHGLDVLNIRTGKVIRHYAAGNKPGDLRSNFIFSLYQARSGQILAGTTAGVFKYVEKKDAFDAIPQLSGYTYNILEDHAGVWWSATISEGVKFYNPASGQAGSFSYNPAVKNSISNNMVNSLFEDSRHNIWMATEGGGACRLSADRKTINRYNTSNGLPSNFVFKILEDNEQHIWITTSKGLVQLNSNTSTTKIYTSANGLLNDQFNYNSGFKDASGTLYFGSVKGMVSFKPASFKEKEFDAPVYFTGFQVNNVELPIKANSTLPQSMLYTREIELAYNQSSFSIDFAALSHTSPQMNNYAYSMEGIDTGWNYLERNRKVYFTDLSPGSYIFKVKATNSNGNWNSKTATLSIVIHPPWWSSGTAIAIYFILAILFSIVAFRYYHRHLKRENQQRIDHLLFEKEKEVYDAKMKFFTNIAHEIKTPLTLIKGPLERIIDKTRDIPGIKNSLAVLERNTDRLLHLTEQLLDYRKTEAGGFVLSFEQENISQLLKETYAGFRLLAEQKKLSLKLKLPEKPLIVFADNEVLNKIISNLLSNAIKYAKKEVTIRLLTEQDKNEFVVQIDNDGFLIPANMQEKVFEPFVRLRGSEKQQGTGIGLALARSLAELHQGTLIIEPGHENINRFVLRLPMLHSLPVINNVVKMQEDISSLPTQNNSL